MLGHTSGPWATWAIASFVLFLAVEVAIARGVPMPRHLRALLGIDPHRPIRRHTMPGFMALIGGFYVMCFLLPWVW